VSSELIGRVVGTYRVESKIGAGGMGEVFKAHDAKLDRPVALKLLPADIASDPDRLRRFHDEARAASSINHPHILVIHDFGAVDGRPFIVSEFIEGETLRERIRRGPIDAATTLHIATQLTSALAAAHARGIVHRDIKPENVMIRPDGYVKVVDFGLMKLMPSGDGVSGADVVAATRTEPGRVLGTPHYMSPEQARGFDTDRRSDVWSVGVTVYEMLAGRPPFAGPSSADVIAAILTVDAPPVDVHAPHVPATFSRILSTTLAKDPARRYRSAAELHAALIAIRPGVDEPVHVGSVSGDGSRTVVGRERERGELSAAVRRVLSGRGELLSISGEPGAGKTTLVETFLRGLHAGDVRYQVARGRCSERLAGAEAYLPVLEALDRLVSDGGSRLVEQMQAVAPAWYAQVASVTPDSDLNRVAIQPMAVSQERLKREMTALLRELSRSEPVIVFFDDVHWADASTIDLLGYLAARFDELRILVIVTSRPSDLLLANHPFLALRRDLQARHLGHEVVLDMLALEDVERYLGLEFAGHRFPAALAALVHAKTEGSPLFMADLVRYLVNSGAIAPDGDGRWSLPGSLEAVGRELPESVRAMIERKIAQLGDDDRMALTAASVQGAEFDSVIVARVLSREAGDLEERLEALDRVHRLVTLVDEQELPDGTLSSRYRFVHVLYQNALYGQLRAARRVALSSAVASALSEAHGGRDAEIASELAVLYEAARQPLRAAQCCRLAAQHASRLNASQEALVLAKRGLSLLASTGPTRERQDTEMALLIGLGNAFIALRGYSSGEVLETYTRALALSEQLGETQDRAAVLYGLNAYHLVGGRHPAALLHARELLSFAERLKHPAVIVAHRMIGWALLAMGQLDEALSHLEQCLALYDPGKHRELAYSFGQDPGMAGGVILSIAQQLLGRAEEARRTRDHVLGLSRQTSHANSRCYVLHFASVQAQLDGDRERTRALADEALRIAEEQGLALWTGWAQITRGWALADSGASEPGLAEMRRGIEAARGLGHELLNTYYLALLAEQLLRVGQCREAGIVLEEAERVATVNEERFFAAPIARLRAQAERQA
jgi:tetratricopeptide (TPR) repeat protein